MTTISKSDIIIIVPTYKNHLSQDERVSFVRCVKLFKSYKICLVGHSAVDYCEYKLVAESEGVDIEIKLFDSEFFDGISGYNKLMLSELLYCEFSTYKYMLVYQLDAYAFRNDLLEWCSRGWDYVGGPIPNEIFSRYTEVFCSTMGVEIVPTNACNGGLSLRKIDAFIKLSQQYQDKMAALLAGHMSEDIIWSFIMQDTIPSREESLQFSFDAYPRECYKENKKRLPMGCHAWYRDDYGVYDSAFWQKIMHPIRYYIRYCYRIVIRKTRTMFRLVFGVIGEKEQQ